MQLLYSYPTGTDVRLQQTDIDVNVGSWAVFNCNVSCDLSKTHTVFWFVGSSRTRLVHSPAKFYEQTGIQVELEELTSCSLRANSESGVAVYQLRVNATSESVELLNKTSVQCAALRKSQIYSDVYSHYGVISINGKEDTPYNIMIKQPLLVIACKNASRLDIIRRILGCMIDLCNYP